MTEHDTKDYEHVYPPYGDGAAQPLRSFDLRTCDERMHTWLAALDRRVQRLEELALHRALNPGEEPDAEEVAA